MEYKVERIVLTYGTFDLFHVGHVRLLKRLKKLGDYLIVGVSTDEFNKSKGKSSFFSYQERSEIVSSCKYVDLVIPEECWEQKINDVKHYNVKIFGIGDDWKGEFDFLEEYCDVVYLSRTAYVSTTSIKKDLSKIDDTSIDNLKKTLNIALEIANAIDAGFVSKY